MTDFVEIEANEEEQHINEEFIEVNKELNEETHCPNIHDELITIVQGTLTCTNIEKNEELIEEDIKQVKLDEFMDEVSTKITNNNALIDNRRIIGQQNIYKTITNNQEFILKYLELNYIDEKLFKQNDDTIKDILKMYDGDYKIYNKNFENINQDFQNIHKDLKSFCEDFKIYDENFKVIKSDIQKIFRIIKTYDLDMNEFIEKFKNINCKIDNYTSIYDLNITNITEDYKELNTQVNINMITYDENFIKIKEEIDLINKEFLMIHEHGSYNNANIDDMWKHIDQYNNYQNNQTSNFIKINEEIKQVKTIIEEDGHCADENINEIWHDIQQINNNNYDIDINFVNVWKELKQANYIINTYKADAIKMSQQITKLNKNTYNFKRNIADFKDDIYNKFDNLFMFGVVISVLLFMMTIMNANGLSKITQSIT